MPKIVLTDITAHQLKTPGLYWDKSLPAFGLRVGKQRKTWLVVPDQRRVRKVIGHYPALPVAKARAQARKLLANRTDFDNITFEDALDQFLEFQKARTRPSSYAGTSRHLNGYLRPKLAKRPLADVKTAEVMYPIDRLLDRPAEASHAFVAARQFFRWAASRRYCANILDGVRLPAKSPARTRVLTDAELKKIWNATTETDGLPERFGTIVQLLLLTAQRRGEIAALRPAYVDLENGTVCLPSGLTKNKREHSFPINALAAETLLKAMEHVASTGYIFPARGNADSTFNGWSKSKAALDKLSGAMDWTLHDIRRSVATKMAEMGVAPHVIERLLNHITGTMSPISLVYNRAKYLEEMRSAMELWEARLQEIIA